MELDRCLVTEKGELTLMNITSKLGEEFVISSNGSGFLQRLHASLISITFIEN